MFAEATWNQFKVLMVGTHRLIRDNVRILLRSLGCGCVIGSSLQEARVLLQKERPVAAVVDQQLLKSTAAEILATLHKVFFSLQGRIVLLTREDRDPQTLKILDAYSIPKVPVDLIFQELWPCLHSLLRRNSAPSVQGGRLVVDSLFQPLLGGAGERLLLYEAGEVMVDLWFGRHSDLRSAGLMGQILDQSGTASPEPCCPVVLQCKAEPIAAAISNAMGEFQLDFDPYPHPPMTLEIGVRERHWVSLDLPDFSSTTQEIQAKAQGGNSIRFRAA